MANSLRFPWLQQSRQRLAATYKRLPHGLMISGPPRIGKSELSLDLARLLLCQLPAPNEPCGECQGCRLIDHQVHPDLHVIAAEASIDQLSPVLINHAQRYWLETKSTAPRKPSKQVGVDVVRSLGELLSATATLGGRKVVLFPQADSLNRNAANALLKLLEEPTAETFLILTTSAPHALPLTVRSRCSRIPCPAPSAELVARWLTSEKGISTETAQRFAASGIGPLELSSIISRGEGDLLEQTLRHIQKGWAEGMGDRTAFSAGIEALGADAVLSLIQRCILDEYRDAAEKQLEPNLQARTVSRFYAFGRARAGLGRSLDPQLSLEDILVNFTE